MKLPTQNDITAAMDYGRFLRAEHCTSEGRMIADLSIEVQRLRDLSDWAETLLCNALPMAHCAQEDWDQTLRKWRDSKHGVSSPNTQGQPRPTESL